MLFKSPFPHEFPTACGDGIEGLGLTGTGPSGPSGPRDGPGVPRGSLRGWGSQKSGKWPLEWWFSGDFGRFDGDLLGINGDLIIETGGLMGIRWEIVFEWKVFGGEEAKELLRVSKSYDGLGKCGKLMITKKWMEWGSLLNVPMSKFSMKQYSRGFNPLRNRSVISLWIAYFGLLVIGKSTLEGNRSIFFCFYRFYGDFMVIFSVWDDLFSTATRGIWRLRKGKSSKGGGRGGGSLVDPWVPLVFFLYNIIYIYTYIYIHIYIYTYIYIYIWKMTGL